MVGTIPSSRDGSSREGGSRPAAETMRRVVFGELQHSDATSAIRRRIRSAIGGGLLADGEKLPKEADLARQLGVTAFALREALSTLRDEGLIVTRPGKNGGSFVQVPPDLNLVARRALEQLTSAELGDLGDWARMLSGQAALLAAQRASGSTSARLGTYAAEVEKANTPQEARRAYARFRLELSAAAQSVRLTRAELLVQEEFAMLAALALDDADARLECALSLQKIAEAVEARDGERARAAGERGQTLLLSRLVRVRLELLAEPSGDAVARKRGKGRTKHVAQSVETFARTLTTQLGAIAEAAAPALAAGGPGSAVNAVLARTIVANADELDGVVHGLGIIAEVGTLHDDRYWLGWWHRDDDGELERDTSHITDPAREDFYDYENREFMAEPRRTGRPWATGPYVDFGGVDDYVVTISVPVLLDGAFLGVAAADILVAQLERRFASEIALSGTPMVLLNRESRVILSSSSTFVGSVVPRSDVTAREPMTCFDWEIATVR